MLEAKKSALSAIGILGLGVMGASLARNFAHKKIPTLVYNRTPEKVSNFLQKYGNAYLQGSNNLQDFLQNLQRPRKIILMIQAGEAVDENIQQCASFLEKDDILIDGGNSHYNDTERRFLFLHQKGISFIGCGISGGEKGALEGPSLMPGGTQNAWVELQPFLEKIAAKDFHGNPCVAYIGSGASGHYVKMIHNGIEYGLMQIMAEAYQFLRKIYRLSAVEIAHIFSDINSKNIQSYLFEIASEVLQRKDDLQQGYLVDSILDKAQQKGTGVWTSLHALEEGYGVSTLVQAVLARFISAEKDLRVKLEKLYYHHEKTEFGHALFKPAIPLQQFLAFLEPALLAAFLSTYGQGYQLLQKFSEKKNWHIDPALVSRVWQGGCIIRSALLHTFEQSYTQVSQKKISFFELPDIVSFFQSSLSALREIVSLSALHGVPVPGFASALFYVESMCEAESPANFIQGLRDYFGAHTYQRIDREGLFHTSWEEK